MRIFRDKWLSRFARRNEITDRDLCEAISRAERGLIDADLGGNVIKQRIPRPHEGRSGGYRTIILFRTQERAFFVFGFAKNELDNINTAELKEFRTLAEIYMALTDDQLDTAIEADKLTEVKCDEQDI